MPRGVRNDGQPRAPRGELQVGEFKPVRRGSSLHKILEAVDAGGNAVGDVAVIVGTDHVRVKHQLRHVLAKKHGIGHVADPDTGVLALVLPPGKVLGDAVRQPSAVRPRVSRQDGEPRRTKNAAADELAASGVAPEKPIVTSETNKHRQRHFDYLAKAAEEGRWEDVAAKHMSGVDTYSHAINRYRDRLLAAHAAQARSQAAE